ncbi:septal ring lytic transglycosylase RlpA family protein [Sphingomonas morindae]|uniref:Endolytic peptidoglycan transglycosylase RlpA n=1 Tax=Sphingomonas morindae TaxID=1541170 RepID=A0ABY4X6T8_9SPHN|nr:septal ring lytic transglycosylase RlpA family protein [Sphingomonas morindae]
MRWRAEARRGAALLVALLLAGCGGGVHQLVADTPVRLGRPYAVAGRLYVPADDRGYDTIGEASWYGSREQGRPTANGERFDKRRASAAHTTLPLPSYVEVTRLDTGERMLVRINDRGPFARDRVLDLSREAARALGIERMGRALVRVRRVQPSADQRKQLRRGYPVMLARVTPTASPLGTGPAPRLPSPAPIMPLPYAAPAPAPYAAPPAAPASATPADADAADALASALSGEAGRVEATGGGYRVVTGPYPDDASRAAALARLRARGYQGAVLLDQTLSDGTTPP